MSRLTDLPAAEGIDTSGRGPRGDATLSLSLAPAQVAPQPEIAGARGQPDLGRETAHQIATQVTQLGKGRFELSLSPGELGKVDMWLHDSDNRLTLTVNAERPETMDLIRRHIGLLEQELRQMGLGSLSLQLGDNGAPGSRGEQQGRDGAAVDAAVGAEPVAPNPSTAPGVARDHLDLRL
ncbi:MAG: Flagellar hook-length control protein [Rhodobacteraceae bacterium HLUCCA12]|nr:MAG: Flagellar hook-length control protein [Rhodobacteraceae bacterium HLUCCA12]